jgi:hypothetical protein
LAFLYCTGAVTFARASTEERFAKRWRFCIPNEDARHDYLQQAHRLLSMDESTLIKYHAALPALRSSGDLAPFMAVFATADRQRTGHAVKNSEAGIQEALFTALALARPWTDRVSYEPRVIPGKLDAMDVLYEARNDIGDITMKIYIELRNLRLEDLILPYQPPFQWSAQANAWLKWLDSASADVNSVKLAALKNDAPDWYRARHAPTVGEYVQMAAQEVKAHYTKHLPPRACAVWLLVRVGVGLVLHECVYLAK